MWFRLHDDRPRIFVLSPSALQPQESTFLVSRTRQSAQPAVMWDASGRLSAGEQNDEGFSLATFTQIAILLLACLVILNCGNLSLSLSSDSKEKPSRSVSVLGGWMSEWSGKRPAFAWRCISSSGSISLRCSEAVARETRSGEALTKICWSAKIYFLRFNIINPLRVWLSIIIFP